MIDNLQTRTGKTLDEWVRIVKSSGLEKHGQMVAFLKSEHAFTHGYANLVALKAREKESGFNAPDETLLDAQYKDRESLRPIYERLVSEVRKFGDDLEIAPKKTYVSLRRNKQFALLQPSTKTRLDVGINLRGEARSGRLEPSGSFSAMCSHRVRVEQVEDVDGELLGWLKEAYDRA